jgi:putative endonuclease
MKGLRREKGFVAERQAARYLKRQGLKWVQSNYRSRLGEIDLIFKEGSQWVFVEVRSRRSSLFMQPEESINKAKQRRLWLTGQTYLQQLPDSQASARFDIVSVLEGECHWVKNAFILG